MASLTVVETSAFLKAGSSQILDQHRRDTFWWRVRMTLVTAAIWVVLGIFAVGCGTVLKWLRG